MKTQLKLFSILIIFLLVVTSLRAQTNSDTITMTNNEWEYDLYCDCGDYYKYYTLNVSPNTPIKINYTFSTYDYLDIFTNDNGINKNYISLEEPTTGTQTVTIISTTGNIYINLKYSWNGMNTGEPVFGTNYSVDPNYTININSSIIQNDQYIGGKLGVGVQPKEKLEVNGSTIINNKLAVGSSSVDYYSKFYLYNNTDYYSQKLYNYKSSTSSTYGLYSFSNNFSGNVYGIYSSVGGQTGKKWAGYFTGGDVAVMSGNLGIGTTASKALLDITGGVGGLSITGTNLDPYFSDKLLPFKNSRKLILGWNYSGGRGEQSIIANGPASLVGGFSFYSYKDDATTATHLMTIEGSGRVGIGTPNPINHFEVVGSDANYFEAAGFYNTYPYANSDKAETRINLGKIENGRQPMGAIGAFPTSNYDSNNGNLVFYTRKSQNMVERVRISKDGNVLIGTTLPDPTNALLTVNGTIHAKEINVTVDIPADYVFQPSYNLMPLNQVEDYVKTNSHLPEIPSAAEITKNGLSVGEMQNKLLLKIEELTLYVIEQQKQIEQQNAKIKNLENNFKH